MQPGAEFLRTAVRSIPFVVCYRRSTVVRPVPPFSAENWMLMRFRPFWSIIERGSGWNLSSTTPPGITRAFPPSRVRMYDLCVRGPHHRQLSLSAWESLARWYEDTNRIAAVVTVQ